MTHPKSKFNQLAAFLLVLITVLAISTGCAGESALSPDSQKNNEITVFAGSSSKVAMEEAGKAFKERTGTTVYFNFGGSGILLSQMKLTRTGDLFIPASPDYIAKAVAENMIFQETEVRIYYLVPAILVQEGNPKNIRSLEDLTRPKLKVAIAEPKTVPAGLFAYELLEYNGMLKQSGNNIVSYAESNDKLSGLVILKTIDAAIGWDNSAVQQPGLLDVVYLQPDQVPRLSYMSGAVATFAKNRRSAQSFLDFLCSEEGQAIFKQSGYYTSESEIKQFAPGAIIGGEYKLPEDYVPLVR